LGKEGQPADSAAANTSKKPDEPVETTTTTGSDSTNHSPDVSTTGDSALSPIAQIAVDNQTGTLPGQTTERPQVTNNGQLEITPLPGSPVEQPAEAVTPVDDKPAPRTRSDEIAGFPPVISYQDGRSDAIELTVKRVSQLPKGDPARELVLRDLAESFERGKTYAERLAAAKALLTLTRGEDGKAPTDIVSRDVLVPERGHWTQAYRNNPAKWVIDVPAKHELQPLKSADVLRFINNSAETIEQETRRLKDAPADSTERHNLQQKLTLIFQTYGDDSPEKLAAARGLIDLTRRADGTFPDLLGKRQVEHAAQTSNSRGRTTVIRAAYTETFETKKSDVDSFLARRSEGLLADTAKLNTADTAATGDLSKRAVNTFFDSKNPEDRTAAAVALLEMGKGPDGTITDQLGSRTVHIPARTQSVSVGRGRSETRILEPAKDRVDTVSKANITEFLTKQLDDPTSPRARILAADALKSAGLINEERYKQVVQGVLADDTAPETLKVELRKNNDLQQEVQKQTGDGRIVEGRPEDYTALDTKPGGQRDLLQQTLLRLTLNPDLKEMVTPEQIETMKKELADGKFGPASRDFYNKSAKYLSEMANGMAVGIVSRNGKLPEGFPVDVPKDTSGRAIGDDLFRAQLLTGRLTMEVKEVKPGELPDAEKLTDTAIWNVKAIKEFDNMRLRWEVAVFDDRLDAFNKNGKLDAWKSTNDMNIDQLRELQSARGEWLNLGIQVRNYAHAIHYFNKSTTDASNIPRLSISRAEMSVFSDEALSDKNFPGKVVRENGKIKSIELDLPTTLDRDNPENLAKVAKLQAWLEKYGPKVDQVTAEITKSTIETGRLLMWGDIDHEGIEETTGKKYNFISNRFTAETVKVKLPDGTEEERIRVVNSKQHRHAGDLSFYKTVGDIEDIGPPITSGEVKVNGQVLSLDNGEEGITLGTKGGIKVTGDAVEAEHAKMRVAADGRIFIKDNGSQSGTYVNGVRIDGSKWVEVFPDQSVTFGKPPASLTIARSEKGEVTFNGQTLKVGEPTKIGSSTAINVPGEGVSGEHAIVKVDADGKIYIKDNGSEKGTFVNGKKVSATEWMQVSDTDQVTFGAPAANLNIQADVRLYKPGDMVTVMMDGQMQLMPAENLSAWGTEAAAWHWTGKGAMAAMDLGMLVSGTIALKGVQVAATQGVKEAGKAGLKALATQMVQTPGFARGAWHLGLGLTGVGHQFIENTGPVGKKFMEIRGYAMMAEIFYGSFIKDGAAIARRAVGMTAPAQEGSAVAAYLKTAPWAARTQAMTDYMFLGMNAYFVPEILAHQMPAIYTSLRKHDAGRLLSAGTFLRADQYTPPKPGEMPPTTLEDQARRFATPETRGMIDEAKREAAEKAALPEDQKQAKDAYLEQLSNRYLDAKNNQEKLAAAFALFTYHNNSGAKELPAVLGTRYKSQNDLPDNVTATEVKAFIDSQIPRSVNLHDKELQASVEARFGDVVKVANKPADDAERVQLNNRLVNEFRNAPDENARVAAAMGLMLLNEVRGKVPDTIAVVENSDGTKTEIKSSEVQQLLSRYQTNALVNRFDSYASTMTSEKATAILDRTREVLTNDNAEERKAEQTRLMEVFEKSTDKGEKAAAALGLLFLSTDKTTGALPDTLAQTTYQVGVNRLVTGGQSVAGQNRTSTAFLQGDKPRSSVPSSLAPVSGAPATTSGLATTGGIYNAAPSGAYLGTVRQTETRSLKTEDVLQFLKGNMPSFDAGTRLAVSDLMYRANEAPMAGRSAFNDMGGVLLSVLEDKSAPPEVRRQALLNAHGLGLSDIMEVHRFATEPGISRMEKTAAAATEADIYGRDSKAIEAALLKIIAEPDGDKDLKALATATLLANSEPDAAKRKAMLAQMQTEFDETKGTDGAYYAKVFERESETFKSMFKVDEFVFNNDADRSKLFRAALMLSKNNNWSEFGITDAQMALAFEQSFSPNQPLVAQHALEPLLKHYQHLDDVGRQFLSDHMIDLIGKSQGAHNSPGHLLRTDVLSRIGEISSVMGPEFAQRVRGTLTELLTPGTVSFISSDENIRASAVRALAQVGSNDQATHDLLKNIVGAGTGKADTSALVRSAAIDQLAAMRPMEVNQLAAKLLETEKDPEVLRKVGLLEQATRRLDPDSKEYQEQFRQAYVRLMESGNNKYSLAQVPDFIKQWYPMLNAEHMQNTVAKRYNAGEGDWMWTWESHGDLLKPYLEQAQKEASDQLNYMISKAATPEGDMERRALAWIVMSNGRFMDAASRDDAVLRASRGLFNAAKTGDAKTKEAVAPLLLMAVSTQDRMPHTARHNLVNAITWLDPGAAGSPISKQDAGIAILAGLKRQFERTPRDGNDPGYKESHDLQMQMLEIYSRYMGAEAIPVLEAMVSNQNKFALGRDGTGRVEDVTYPDQSKRSVEYNQNNEIWRMSLATKDGATQTLVRNGTSNEWYDENDPEKKTVLRGTARFDHESGNFQVLDAYGKSTTYTPDGSVVERVGDQVRKVTYPDRSSRELNGNRETFIDAKGVKQVWVRDGQTNTWYRDTDTQKKTPWKGTFGFDANGDYFRQEDGKAREVTRPSGSRTVYENGKAVYSTPGAADYSAHPMPMVRDKAQELLGQLRDGTAVLRRDVQLDAASTTQQLADNLRRAVESRTATSEDVAKAIFTAGMSKPIESADDPRRAILQRLLNDPHERIRLAAARVLFNSTAAGGDAAERNLVAANENKELAAKVIADIAKNGSRQGYRDDAAQLISSIKAQRTGETPSADELLLGRAMESTADNRRIALINNTGRTIDQQEKYERALGAMIRDTQVSLDQLDKAEWWTAQGYGLLEATNWRKAEIQASDGVSFNPWEKVVHIFDGDPAAKKYKAAQDSLVGQMQEQFKKMTDNAQLNNESPEAVNARRALAMIVLSNGYPLPPELRESAIASASRTLEGIYRRGGPGADYAAQIIEATLVSNPGVKLDVRERFVHAVRARLAQDESVNGNASKTKSATLLAAALEAEHLAMPQKGQPGYDDSLAFQSMILNNLDRMEETIALPVLDAVAAAHPDQWTRDRAANIRDRFKDATSHLVYNASPDTTTAPAQRAQALRAMLGRTDVSDEEMVREMGRLAHPRTLRADDPKTVSDPRIPVLRAALNHSNERIRMAAASILLDAGDARGIVAISELRDSGRAGIKKEADTTYSGTFMSRAFLKVNGDSEQYLREVMTGTGSERARLAAAHTLLFLHPNDAAAREALAKAGSSTNESIRTAANQITIWVNNNSSTVATQR